MIPIAAPIAAHDNPRRPDKYARVVTYSIDLFTTAFTTARLIRWLAVPGYAPESLHERSQTR